MRVLPSPVIVGDYWFVYVWMTNFAEDAHLSIDPYAPSGKPASAIGLVKFRQEGFASMDAPYGEAVQLAMGRRVIKTPPTIFCMEKH